MEEDFLRFGEQLTWNPSVTNAGKLGSYKRFVVLGMGGSNLGSWLIQKYAPAPEVLMHRDYGLPALADWSDTLVIASSYSGNTEETIDGAQQALKKNFPVAVISVGGTLLALAKEQGLPYVQIPETGLEPRMALGYSTLGLAALMGKEEVVREIHEIGASFDPATRKTEGGMLAQALKESVPLIYASTANLPLAYIWKINFNENAKIPAFLNSVPELCHNELNGFGVVDTTRVLSARMHVLMLEDVTDHPRIARRMSVLKEMLAEQGIVVTSVPLEGKGLAKAFDAAMLVSWTSLALLNEYGVPGKETPMIAEFKKRMG